MEKRDLYDKNKNVTGKFIYKDDNIPDKYYELIVVIFIKNSADQFLIQRTSVSKGHKWASTGGHPVMGQSSKEGILTEVKEELGIDLPKEKIQYVTTIMKKKHIVDLYYITIDINIENLKLQSSEVESVEWLTRKEIEDLINSKKFHKTHGILFHEIINYLE